MATCTMYFAAPSLLEPVDYVFVRNKQLLAMRQHPQSSTQHSLPSASLPMSELVVQQLMAGGHSLQESK